MNPLSPERVESVRKRLEFVSVELADLKGLRDLDYATYQQNRMMRRNVERAVENTINALLDICKILLAAGDLDVPETYAGILASAHLLGLVDEDQNKRLRRLAEVRNALAHRYLEYKWPAIKTFLLDDIDLVEDVLQAVRRLLPG